MPVALFPQLAKNAEITDLSSYITDPSWVIEQKLDGHRLFFKTDGDGLPQTMTRNGTSYTKKLPAELNNYRFPPGEWVLDGELVADVVNGHTVGGTLWVFDMPIAGGTDMTKEPLERRRQVLEAMLPALNGPFRLVPQAKTQDEKIALSHRALQEGYEGMVLKRIGSPYRSAGRTDEWLKLKFVTTVDVIVTDVRADGKDSIGYAVHEGGSLKPIGRASLIGKEKARKINVGDVVEVRYLYVGSDGRLYQPTIVGVRDDKQPIECTGDQLRHVNKAVLEVL